MTGGCPETRLVESKGEKEQIISSLGASVSSRRPCRAGQGVVRVKWGKAGKILSTVPEHTVSTQ